MKVVYGYQLVTFEKDVYKTNMQLLSHKKNIAR